MRPPNLLTPAAIDEYLQARPRRVRWFDALCGRKHRITRFAGLSEVSPEPLADPLVVVAHRAYGSFGDAWAARQIALAIEQDWAAAPSHCREAFEEILFRAPGLIVIQLRRKNLCGCLGHRHVVVKEAPFAESHEALQVVSIGELDIAYERVETWQALPLSDTALDVKFLEGSRQAEFRGKQFRLKLLSILLHEINHLVSPQEPEDSVRKRSLAFYHDALAHYVENAVATLSLTIDRSFSRLG
jgi:hypothetical protein